MKKAMLIEETTGLVTEVPIEEVDKNWFRRPSNYKLGQFDKDIETKREVSLTVPGQSYTLREILEKYTRGIELYVEQEGTYENPEDVTGLEPENAIDITDVEEQLSSVSERISFAKSKSEQAKISVPKTPKEDEGSEVKPEANNSQK